MAHDGDGDVRRWSMAAGAAVLAVACLLVVTACSDKQPPPKPAPRWPELPLPEVAPYMRGTLYERVRFSNLSTMPVFGYSMVANLHGTGDATAPNGVRDYIVRQILLHGFDSFEYLPYKSMTADQVLNDRRVAIVVVQGQLPVGARSGQQFDVAVRAMPRSRTTSLAHGDLYQTALSDHGLIDPMSVLARPMAYVHGGQVFVNPMYAETEGHSKSPEVLTSLQIGTILNGGVVKYDRPIFMQLRQPQLSTARLIEAMIAHHWRTPTEDETLGSDRSRVIAAAQDEGLVQMFVPQEYKGNWKHFLGVVSHLYLSDSSGFVTKKAMELAKAAHDPKVNLADISLCWEALGPEASSYITPLMSDPDPDIAFAAARAMAYMGDPTARQMLLTMATDPTQHNQLEAVRVIGELPTTAETRHMLRSLMSSSNAEVRIAAYRILTDNAGTAQFAGYTDDAVTASDRAQYGMMTIQIGDRFILDLVQTDGLPMVYATTSGIPRMAIFGHHVSLMTPITFTAMDERFSVSSSDGTDLLTMFYRDPTHLQPVDALTKNDLGEIMARMGGEGPMNQDPFSFSYGDVVAIAEQMVRSHHVVGTDLSGDNQRECVFQLQHQQLESDVWTSIPRGGENGRQQGTPDEPVAIPATQASGGG